MDYRNFNIFCYDGHCFLGFVISPKWYKSMRNFRSRTTQTQNGKNNNYIKIYDNLHLISTQLLIRDENRNKSGIYCILNKINNNIYIGSAITNRINTRFRNHCIHGTGSSILKKAIDKYNLDNFQFIILEYYPGQILKENLNKYHLNLLELETFYIKKYQPEYNILKSAFDSLGYKHSEETKLKMRESNKQNPDKKLFIIELNKNKLSLLAKLRYQLQPNLIYKLSELASKPVQLYNQDDTLHSEYSSIRHMAKAFQCCHKTINKAIRNKTIFRKIGYIKYKTQ